MDSLAVSYAAEVARWGIETSIVVPGALPPPDADPSSVARAIVALVGRPFGKHPFWAHVDPSHGGCGGINGVASRVRTELLRHMASTTLLLPETRF